MSEHTPGPWTFKATPYGGFDVYGSTDDRNPIAGVGVEHDTDEEANARLIAAAPEMLELLKRATDYANCCVDFAADCKTLVKRVEGRE